MVLFSKTFEWKNLFFYLKKKKPLFLEFGLMWKKIFEHKHFDLSSKKRENAFVFYILKFILQI